MTRPSTEEIYASFAPLGEWLNPADPEATAAIIEEDAVKRERLLKLNEIIGLPTPAYTFIDPSVLDRPEDLRGYFGEVDEEKDRFAVAFLPKEEGGGVRRHRGLLLQDCFDWALANRPDKGNYDFLVEPSYEQNEWSTIFVVDNEGVYGEVIEGQHFQLTQGAHITGTPSQFLFKNDTLYISGGSGDRARNIINEFIRDITVTDSAKRAELYGAVGARFTVRGQLKGYFEAVTDTRFGKAFIDYNRLLGRYFTIPDKLQLVNQHEQSTTKLTGKIAVEGMAEGTLLSADQMAESGDIERSIFTAMLTRAENVPLMMVADGIVTEMGGITSHAAVVARMIGKPCLVGVEGATQHLGRDAVLNGYNGQLLLV